MTSRRLIVHGSNASNTDFPSVVRIYSSDNIGFCGGFIASPVRVVTAAHCMSDFLHQPGLLRVGVGKTFTWASMDGQLHNVTRIVTHPAYNHSRPNAILYGNDISVLVITPPIVNASIGVLDDGSHWSDISHPFDDNAYVVGYGSQTLHGTQSPRLQIAHVHLHGRAFCESELQYKLVPSNGCANYRFYDACSGDSGSPLFMAVDGRFVIVGTVSWGFGECGNIPGVYNRVGTSLAFLNENDIPTSAAASFYAPAENCSCTSDCKSNGFSVIPQCSRCDAPNISFCYTQGYCHLPHSEHSILFPGAMWRDCVAPSPPPLPPSLPPSLPRVAERKRESGPSSILILGLIASGALVSILIAIGIRMRFMGRRVPTLSHPVRATHHARSIHRPHQRH